MATSQRRSTAYELISQLMKSMGMTVPTTLAGSADKRSAQFWQLATDSGQELAAMNDYRWQILNTEYLLTTVIGQASYALPDDFGAFIQDSSWNRSTQLPALGSITEPEWQALKARTVSGTVTTLYRIVDDTIQFYNTPQSVQTIALPYTSRNWVRAGATYKDNLETDTDVVLFDPQLFKAKLKLKWYEEKGFDTTKQERNFLRACATAKGNDVPGRTLSLVPRGGYPYLGVLNVPDTGYGS